MAQGIFFAASTFVGSSLYAAAPPTPEQVLATQAFEVTHAVPVIADALAEVTILRDLAAKDHDTVKVQCVEQHLRRIQASYSAAKVVESTWSSARLDPAFAERTLYRMQMLKLAAMGSAASAHSCAGDGTDVTVSVTNVAEHPVGSAPPLEQVTAPVIERPPLASPY